jgi:hypothetical protein
MKKIFALILNILLFISQTFAQSPPKNNGVAEGIGAVAGISAAFIGAAITIDILKEKLEDEACKYVFRELPDYTNFSLKILEFNATKLSDLSGVSVIPFALKKESGSPEVILMVTDPGWVNDYGINFTKVLFYRYSVEKWDSLITNFIDLASSCKIKGNEIPLYKSISTKEALKDSTNDDIIFVNKKGYKEFWVKSNSTTLNLIYDFTSSGIYCIGGGDLKLPFNIIDGDSHVSKKLSNDLVLDYNEKSINLYFIHLNRIVKFNMNAVESIHKFLHSIPEDYIDPKRL